MKSSLIILWLYSMVLVSPISDTKNRVIIYNETEYDTTYDVAREFIGTYKGRKTGYLILNDNGTGEYKYDVFGFARVECDRSPIKFIWGFIIDKENVIIKTKRNYGYSYQILLESSGTNSFQGCRTIVLKDFILDRGSSLHVSSSDDWKKNKE